MSLMHSRRNIHPDAEFVVAEFVRPRGNLGARDVEHVLGEGGEQTTSGRDGDEDVRSDEFVGVAPSRQRLETDGATGSKIDDCLVIGLDDARFDCYAQGLAQPDGWVPGAHGRRLVEDRSPFARPFGTVHRGISACEERVHILIWVVAPDVRGANAGRDHDRCCPRGEGLAECRTDPLGQSRGVRRFGEYREFVAAESGQRVRGREHRAQSTRDHLEQAVACGVPHAVVHGLEIVEVDQHHGAEAARGFGEGAVHHVEELRAVRQTGEVVVKGIPVQLRLAIDRLEAQVLGKQDLAQQRCAESQQGSVVQE